ncbi:sugar phosphate isomerase/epimerase [Paenibacillus rhizosphaerae]|uniref:Sugar phosphate isomerase/epimerase n=1 Tax=Paenibacillus rhizosphaerae TaxID=297318 RepID=A0A839TKJ7_9BACL|nr:sugar phosphate isomerase/epimerase [Paenibacillus rhizosphaerae]MBB3127043.1 sugar phosphate isomerase/epimerase [Paenibacillus rhizosphaerae]
MTKPIVGIQLYTLRDQTEKDFLGTIRKVAEMGYQAVEFAGFFETPAKEIRALLEELNLKAPSAHIGLNFREHDKLSADLNKQIEYAKEIGLEYIVVPWSPLPDTPTEADVKQLANILEQTGKQVTDAGLKFGYHNHDFEFKLVGGKPVIDHLLEIVPAEYLFAEFDLGWVHFAGFTPAEYVKKYAGRVPLAHFKDFADGHKDTEVGKGSVDLKSVLNIAEASGIQYFIVEQEEFASSSLESARLCLEFFRENGF